MPVILQKQLRGCESWPVSYAPGTCRTLPGEASAHLLVTSEHGRRDEGLVAQLTTVLLVPLVDHLDVDIQRVLPFEGGLTVVTLKSPLTWETESDERSRNRQAPCPLPSAFAGPQLLMTMKAHSTQQLPATCTDSLGGRRKSLWPAESPGTYILSVLHWKTRE